MLTNTEVINAVKNNLFHERLHKARQAFSHATKGTNVDGNLVCFRDTTQVYSLYTAEFPLVIMEKDIPEDALPHVKRIHQITQEQTLVANALRYMGNYFDTAHEFAVAINQYVDILSDKFRCDVRLPPAWEDDLEEQLNLINQSVMFKYMYV